MEKMAGVFPRRKEVHLKEEYNTLVGLGNTFLPLGPCKDWANNPNCQKLQRPLSSILESISAFDEWEFSCVNKQCSSLFKMCIIFEAKNKGSSRKAGSTK